MLHSEKLLHFKNSPVANWWLFTNIQNIPQLLQTIKEPNHPVISNVSIIDPALIWSHFHLLSAVHKALWSHIQDKKTTKTLYSEILYSLSPRSSITEAYKNFGLNENSTAALVVAVSLPNEAINIKDLEIQITSIINGKLSPWNENVQKQLVKKDFLRKIYKLKDVSDDDLENHIVERMALKGL